MASPTEAELNAQIQNAVALLDHLLATQTVAADEDTYDQSIESDFAASQAQGARLFRSRVATAISTSQQVLAPVLTAYAHHVIQTPERSPQLVLDRIYDYFVANDHSVPSRGITFGTPGSFSAGKGGLKRLTADENGCAIEAVFLDTKTLRCIADENTGANRYEETFELRGKALGVDALATEAGGSGVVRRDVKAITHRSSLLKNPAWNQTSLAGSVAVGTPYALATGDTITGWSVTTAVTNLTLDADDVPWSDGIVGETLPRSLHVEANETITQTLKSNNVSINPAVPHVLELWVKPTTGTTAGTLTLTCGSKTQAYDLFSGMTVGSWNRIFLDMDSDLWPANFVQANATVALAVSGLTGGTGVKLYGVTLAPMLAFDGLWYYPYSGTTKFVLDDSVTVADTLTATDSKIQRWLWRAFARYLPHRAPATTVTAAGGRTLTFVEGGGSADTIVASTGSFVTDGYYAGMLLTVAGTTNNNGTYTLATVAALTLTLATTDDLVDEGPLSATATLNATASLTDPL